MIDDEHVVNKEENESIFIVKKVMRFFSLMCVIFVFCPMFLVSCSGQKKEVDIMTAVSGVSMYGEMVVEPHPIMLICLVFPVLVFVILHGRKLGDKKIATCSLVCIVVDFIVWWIFKSIVEEIAKENYCSFETTGWFYANMISMIIITIFALLVMIGGLRLDTDLMKFVRGNISQIDVGTLNATIDKMTNTVNNFVSTVKPEYLDQDMNIERIGYCMKCGSAILYGSKFCTSCGNEVPQSLLEDAEKQKNEEVLVDEKC